MNDLKFLSPKYRSVLMEFIRYLIVGGIASVFDLGIGFVFRQWLLPHDAAYALYAATTFGFLGGLIINYVLSIMFVFTNNSKKGKTFSAFLIFAFVGTIGLGFTNMGMWIGDKICKGDTLGIKYIIIRIIVMGLVLIWNYLGRKMLVFRKDK